MRRTLSLLSAAALTITATLAATAAPVAADPPVPGPPVWAYSGVSGGTEITALGTTISSGLTASSNLTGTTVPAAHSTAVAAVNVPNLVAVGAITSGQIAEAYGDGVQITSSVQTAGVNLLNGAIKAEALQTTAFANATTDGVNGGAATKAVRLIIGGSTIPIDVAPNTKIVIPGIASVVINESKVTPFPLDASIRATGAALDVTLLKAQGKAPAGARIIVNPVEALVVPSPPSDASPVGGFAYGLFAGANVGKTAKVYIQPTGILSVPQVGTNGVTYSNNVAGVKLTNVANVGAVTTSMNALTISGFAEVTTGAEIAKVNLLNGLITADAIQVTAHVRRAGPFDVSEAKTNFVNLTIAGKPIDINVKPNTLINVLGICKIWINQQITVSGNSTVSGLHIVLTTAKYGLPIGADIQVATANASIG